MEVNAERLEPSHILRFGRERDYAIGLLLSGELEEGNKKLEEVLWRFGKSRRIRKFYARPYDKHFNQRRLKVLKKEEGHIRKEYLRSLLLIGKCSGV